MTDWKECRIVKMHAKGLVEVEWQDGTRTVCKSLEVLNKVPLKVKPERSVHGYISD